MPAVPWERPPLLPEPLLRGLSLAGVLSLAACSPGSSTSAEDSGSVQQEDEEDSGPLTSWTVDEIEDQEVSDDWLFDTTFIHEVSIELSDESVDALWAEPAEYAIADVTIDGLTVNDVGVRLRGKIGSFRTLSGKPKWKIDFNRFVEGQRFSGLEALSLNNAVVDCSYLKETIAADTLAALEVPGSRAAYTHLTVNGKDYGLNILMEVQDDRFLKRAYPEPDGNLYDAKYWYDASTGNYVLLDFGWGLDEVYQLEEGEEVGHEDVKAISAAYLASAGQPDFYETMGEVVDWDRLLRGWAAEQWLGQNDGYALNRNNTRLYFNPETDRAEQVLWDFDYSFLNASDWSRSWSSPTGNLAYYCRYDATCSAHWKAVVEETLDVVDGLGMDERFDDYKDLISDEIRGDPRKECSQSYVNWYQDWVEDWVKGGSSQTVRANWGL